MFDREWVSLAGRKGLITGIANDVGLATAYLATDAAKLITGQTLFIDGGYHFID